MKNFLSFTGVLAFDAVQLALAWLWLGPDRMPGAGNAFLVVTWTLVLLQLLTALICLGDGMNHSRHPAVRVYTFARFLVKFVGYAWFGLFWLVGVYAVAQFLGLLARHQHTLKTAASA